MRVGNMGGRWMRNQWRDWILSLGQCDEQQEPWMRNLEPKRQKRPQEQQCLGILRNIKEGFRLLKVSIFGLLQAPVDVQREILLLQDPQKYSLYKPWAQSSTCWWVCLVHHCLDLCSVSDWVSDSGGRQDWLEDSEGLHRVLWRCPGGIGRAIPPFVGGVLVDSGCSDQVSLTKVAYK